jgi:glycosyltransferase involved in cell wall biosynthesis
MKVCVASLGRFHLIDLAREMHRLGHLERMYTALPKRLVPGVPKSRLASFPLLLGPTLLGRLGWPAGEERLNPVAMKWFDRWTAARLGACDVFHCLSGFGLEAHVAARARYGAVTVCDRGSSHILYQDTLLAEEYARWGARYRGIDSRIVERECREYELCDLITVPSTFAYDSFLARGVPREKLIKIPYGVDLGLFRPLGKRDGTFRVLYVGALSLRKGIPYLLEAVVSAGCPDWELWLAGAVSDEARSFLTRAAGRYRYLGVIPRAELAEYYSQASVFVLASVEEGLALVQAQAMACGLPVIATRNSGAEDLFTDGVEGFIVPIRSTEAIRDRLVYFYENPEARRHMGEAALRKVRSLEGWSAYGRTMEDAYIGALAREKIGIHANPTG